jgi:tetratricopeptide (TPR) repeat protein
LDEKMADDAAPEPEALDRYRRAPQLSGELGDPYEEATQLGKVAAALEKMNRFEEAIATYEKAVELYRKIEVDPENETVG